MGDGRAFVFLVGTLCKLQVEKETLKIASWLVKRGQMETSNTIANFQSSRKLDERSVTFPYEQ